jgi:hypothetical protein
MECTVYCKGCDKDLYRVLRKPTQREGVSVHELDHLAERCEGCEVQPERRE